MATRSGVPHQASVRRPDAPPPAHGYHHQRNRSRDDAHQLFNTAATTSTSDDMEDHESVLQQQRTSRSSRDHSTDDSESVRSRYQSARDRVSFLSRTPIEEFIAKYQVIKCSWRGKYERILAMAPTRFCTIDPKDFEVTNTWSFQALLSITLDASDPEGFTLLLKGPKKDEQLKLRCRFRSRLLSDLYRLQDQILQRRSKAENQFPCTKWSRKDASVSCVLEVGLDAVIVAFADGSPRSKYMYVDMEHLSTLSESRDGLAFGYAGRSRLFFSDKRGAIMQRIQAAAEAIGCMIHVKAGSTVESVKHARAEYGSSIGQPFVQFSVRKLTAKYAQPVERVLSLHEKHLAELDGDGEVVSCLEYKHIGVLVRQQKSLEDFEVQYSNGETRKYVSSDRDGVLAALYDLCVTCNENPELLISCGANERGLRLLPFFAAEDASETASFFGDSSIGSSFLHRLASVGKLGGTQKMGDKGFVEIAAEFNANVPTSGLVYNTKQSIISEALRPIGAQLYYISKSKPLPSRSAVTLLQTLCRITSSYYGFREVAQVGHMADSITNLLRSGDEFAVFWTTLLLRKLTVHIIPPSTNLDTSSIQFCDEVEAYNKNLLFGNSYLVQSLVNHLDGVDVERRSIRTESVSPSAPAPRRVGPLVLMGLLQTLEGCLCSRKVTTGSGELRVLVAEVAKRYSTLLKVLFQSRCATTVEACTLLLKTTLEECDPAVAMQIRDAALVEGIVLRHVYQAIFDPSFDQRCVSRYLISLWMSHHTRSKQLLARIIPAGFFQFLKEPPASASELEELDQLELESLSMEREDAREFNDDDRLSFLSDASAPDEINGAAEDTTFFGSEMLETRRVHARSVSVGELNDSPSLTRGSGPRRQSLSVARSSLSSDARSSVSWISATVRESFHIPIENDHTKARMLQKLHNSSRVPPNNGSSTDNALRQHLSRTNGAQRVRKRDIVSGFISSALSKTKSEKLVTRRSSKQLKEGSSQSVMASRRQENFRLLFFMLSRDHEEVDLIWNRASREELRRALFLEIERFSKYQISHGNGKALWNYEDFHVRYESLAHEVIIGGCYVRILSSLVSKQSVVSVPVPSTEDRFVALAPDDVPVRNPRALIAALYRRILRENIRAEHRDDLELSLLCIKGLAIVSAAHANSADATDFDEIDYLTTLMRETVHAPILASLHEVVRALCLYAPNARRFATDERSLDTVVKMLQMAHTSHRSMKLADAEKVWILESLEGDVFGPLSVDDLKVERTSKDVAQFWIRRRDDRVSQHTLARCKLMDNMQLRWELGVNGSLDPLQTAHDAINILLAAARSNSLLALPNAIMNADTSDGGLYPAPRAKCSLWGYTQQLIPLLLRVESPQLSHRVAVLLEFLFADQVSITRSRDEHATNRSSLFYWGTYIMAFVANPPQFDELAGLLQATHLFQSGFGGKSALTGILPDAMIQYLSLASASDFSRVFCGAVKTPSVIWSPSMRGRLRASCFAHLRDYMVILEEDVTSAWKFSHMAPVAFDELQHELWCGDVFLGEFCEHEDFRVKDPLEFMAQLAQQWRDEVARKHAVFDRLQAASFLGLPADVDAAATDLPVIREGFRQKAMELEAEMFSSLEYDLRLSNLKEAYWVLTCPRPSLLSEGHDPVNLLLLLRTFVVMCNRYPAELSMYEFDCFDLVLSLLESHCSADGTLPSDTTAEQRSEISLRAAELLQQACAVSAYNGDVLLDEPELRSLEKVMNYCVNAIVEDSVEHAPELLEICFYIMQTITGLVASPRGRVWVSGSTTLIVDMVRILWVWNHSHKRSFFLSKITQQVLEGVSRMCLLEHNQDLLLQRGVLWQLLVLCFKYDIEIDDATVRARLQSSSYSRDGYASMEDEAHNLLAIMAVRAICRLGGIFPDGSELCSPRHARVKAATDALLTPNLAALLELSSHHEYLKIFHTNCESYTLFWTESMRRELLAFVAPRASLEPSQSVYEDYLDAIRFRFEYLAQMFNVGGLYIDTLMASFVVIKESAMTAPVPELGLTEAFFKELFAFIDNGELKPPSNLGDYFHDELPLPYSGWGIARELLQTNFRVTALECLAVISFVVPAFVVRNIVADVGLIKMILRLLFPPDHEVHEDNDAGTSTVFPLALYAPSRDHCLAILESLSCVDDFGRASAALGICDIMIEVVHVSKAVGPEALSVIRNLCAHGTRTEFVTEILQSGCYIEFIAWMLLVEDIITDEDFADAQHLRQPCVEILAEIGKPDAPKGEEAQDALRNIFPTSIVLELVQHPGTFIEYFTSDHENPELVWNAEFRSFLQDHVTSFLGAYYSSPSLSEAETATEAEHAIESEQPPPQPMADRFFVDYFSISPYPIAGNVHLPLFLKNPTFELRDPLFFVTCLWEEFEILIRELAHITSSLRQTMSPDDDATAQRGFELLDLATSCLVCALQVNPWVLEPVASLRFPEYCCNFLNETVRHQSAEPCIVHVVRLLRIFTLSKACVAAMQPVVPTALTCLMSAINPFRRGALHYESGYTLEIMRRIVQFYPEHGDRDASNGIVFVASRLDLFGYLLNILENPESLGTVKDPRLVRAAAVDILNMLEKDRVQGHTAHQILKKHKKWEKKFRFEPTDSLRAIATEDPFLQKQNPHLDQLVREFVRSNPPRTRPVHRAPGSEQTRATAAAAGDRTGRASMMRSYRESPSGKVSVARLAPVSEKKKPSVVKKLFK